MLYVDYFENTALFKSEKFRRRFRMARHVFNRIRERVVAHDPYFECKTDALGKLGFSSYHKCTAAICMLAYGIPGDLVDACPWIEVVKRSVCIEGARRALARAKVHWGKLDAERLITDAPPAGKEYRTPEM